MNLAIVLLNFLHQLNNSPLHKSSAFHPHIHPGHNYAAKHRTFKLKHATHHQWFAIVLKAIKMIALRLCNSPAQNEWIDPFLSCPPTPHRSIRMKYNLPLPHRNLPVSGHKPGVIGVPMRVALLRHRQAPLAESKTKRKKETNENPPRPASRGCPRRQRSKRYHYKMAVLPWHNRGYDWNAWTRAYSRASAAFKVHPSNRDNRGTSASSSSP